MKRYIQSKDSVMQIRGFHYRRKKKDVAAVRVDVRGCQLDAKFRHWLAVSLSLFLYIRKEKKTFSSIHFPMMLLCTHRCCCCVYISSS
jgi:hypothetical protein